MKPPEPAVSQTGNRSPNIVLIVADDLGYGAQAVTGSRKSALPILTGSRQKECGSRTSMPDVACARRRAAC